MNRLKLSNWTYQIKQIGAGLYVLQGVDNRGNRLDSVGADSDILEANFVEAAQKIDQSDASPIPIDWG